MSDLRTYINLVESAQIDERYSSDNIALQRYLDSSGAFDPYSCWHEVCNWIEENGYLEEISEALGEEINSADDLVEQEPDVFHNLPKHVQKECGEACIEWLLQNDPAEAPSTAYMSLNRKNLLPRTTWLIHFSDEAENIASVGFKYGIDQMDKLGLTTYLSDAEKAHGGYNFAFHANGRYAYAAARQGKYGRHAVIFQNSGVEVHHSSDEETQVIFHGTDVNPRDTVLLKNDGGDWKVMTAAGRAVFTGEFQAAVAWVQKHFAQYRRALTGR